MHAGPVLTPPPPIVLPVTPQRGTGGGAQVSAASVGQQGRRRLLEGAAADPGGSGGLMQSVLKAFHTTMAKALTAVQSRKAAAGAGTAQSQPPAGDQVSGSGLRIGTAMSSVGEGAAAPAPAAGSPQQAGEGGGVEGKRTQLRMGLNLPGDDDLAAVAFLDVGPSEQAVSPQGAPTGGKFLQQFAHA